jgi:CRISPR-associated endonuclease/helicase Cas3
MCDVARFDTVFEALTGNPPFPWQQSLYDDWFAQGVIPPSCNLPTGLGKTSVIPIWLIALANNPGKVPRRLVYVVNRRTVVDQATAETEKIRDRLLKAPADSVLAELAESLKSLAADPSDDPLAISTLRGQFADNGQWRADPARPAVVVGTVDMIGSRLLFSGYGLSHRTRPLHAGFLGQDSLIVHDEAHLEPAFQELLESIVKEQTTGRTPDKWPLQVMELTATSRSGGQKQFGLTDKDRKHPVVKKRLDAEKAITFHCIEDEKKTADQVANLALQHADSGQAILVFLRKLDDVEKVAEVLRKTKVPDSQIERLTGTLRGKERDELVTSSVFQRFLPANKNGAESVTAEGTVYLLCTSAGEVGVNISADHLVCDLTPFDSMAQRFGRVNRFGDGSARIDVVHPLEFNEEGEYEKRRRKSLDLLKRLPEKAGVRDASPGALAVLPPGEKQEAFTPPPVILPATDILFDAWALTSIRDKLPGRPPVEQYLHGIQDWEPPETHVAWREEVERISDDMRDTYKPADLLEDYPLKPHELLRDNSNRVFKHLMDLTAVPKLGTKDREAAVARADRNRRSPVWVIEPDGAIRPTTLGELVEAGKERLFGRTVLLPSTVGGLQDGMLSGESKSASDVADEWRDDKGQQRRMRVWDDDSQRGEKTAGLRLIRTIEFRPPEDGEDVGQKCRFWLWYERPKDADGEGSKTASEPVTWQDHTDDVAARAAAIVARLSLDADLREAVHLVAKWHDLGKQRLLWQRSIGNPCPEQWLAKSGKNMKPREMTEYRHEFGSLLDVLDENKAYHVEWKKLNQDMQDLVLHALAAGHGWARPHFPDDAAFDPESLQNRWSEASQEVPRRFARIQRKYGRWGLAYIESLLRAADYAASANPLRSAKTQVEDKR